MHQRNLVVLHLLGVVTGSPSWKNTGNKKHKTKKIKTMNDHSRARRRNERKEIEPSMVFFRKKSVYAMVFQEDPQKNISTRVATREKHQDKNRKSIIPLFLWGVFALDTGRRDLQYNRAMSMFF
jgi:hypothetical protein